MTDVIQAAGKAVSAVSSVTHAVGTVESVAGDAAKLAGTSVGDVAKVATTAVGGLLTGLMPYVLGSLGAVILGLGGTVFWDHRVTIPQLRANLKAASADISVANGQTAACNLSQDNLRSQVDQQNQQIAALQAQAAASAQRANTAAAAVAARPLAPPPADQSAAAVNAYLQSLRALQ